MSNGINKKRVLFYCFNPLGIILNEVKDMSKKRRTTRSTSSSAEKAVASSNNIKKTAAKTEKAAPVEKTAQKTEDKKANSQIIKDANEINLGYYEVASRFQSIDLIEAFYEKMNEMNVDEAAEAFINTITDPDRAISYEYLSSTQTKEDIDNAYLLGFLTKEEIDNCGFKHYRNPRAANIQKLIKGVEDKIKSYQSKINES